MARNERKNKVLCVCVCVRACVRAFEMCYVLEMDNLTF
jgi:hypothetical protein